jgi:tRNA-dihydrouridine synthase B
MRVLQSDYVFTPLAINELRDIMLGHLEDMHRFYGEHAGVRVARKHLTWYCKHLVSADDFHYQVVRVESAAEQLRLAQEYFDRDEGGISLAA